MRDDFFNSFIRKLGEATQRSEVPAARIDKYRGLLPDRLLRYWESEGWSAYGNGLFWLVDPDVYKPLLDTWLENTDYESIDNYHVFARTAFGKLYAWGEHSQRDIEIACSVNRIMPAPENIKRRNTDPEMSMGTFFAVSDAKYHDFQDDEGNRLFESARQALGDLNASQVYGFVPALVMGGSPRLENLRKLEIDVHLTMLRQFS